LNLNPFSEYRYPVSWAFLERFKALLVRRAELSECRDSHGQETPLARNFLASVYIVAALVWLS
jgi:hypothetical protein